MTTAYLLNAKKKSPSAQPLTNWPSVCIQIPLFNEAGVIKRIIDCVCAFQYPKEQLEILILDDSSDKSTEIAQESAARYRTAGINIRVLHRAHRNGFKAGALDEALAVTQAEYIVVFDADFIPPPDYLMRVIPLFSEAPALGMVQARWGHINRQQNMLTRVQSIFLDGHQIVEQVGRSRSGLLCNFNGSGGTWRTECIRSSGGWQSDTLSEDIDLSFRAQMKGWRLTFLPDLVVPAEVPPKLSIFQKQQYRWNYGYAQVLKKLGLKLITRSTLTIPQRLFGWFQLAANLANIAGLLVFLLCVPLALLHPEQPSSLGMISITTSGPGILFIIAQLFGYQDQFSKRIGRVFYLPILILLTIGTSLSNSHAVISALLGKPYQFHRTQKTSHSGPESANEQHRKEIRWTVFRWLEVILMFYMGFGLYLAIKQAPELISLSLLGLFSFGFVVFGDLVDQLEPQAGKIPKINEPAETR